MSHTTRGARALSRRNSLFIAAAFLLLAVTLASSGGACPIPQEPLDQGEQQGDEEPAKKAYLPPSEILAIVVGRIITFGEIEERFNALRDRYPNESESIILQEVLVQHAVRVLLAETAKMYSEDVSDEEVISRMTRYLELDEKVVVKNLAPIREDYLIMLYLDGRMGLNPRLKGVSPDLAEQIRVTPQEIKDFYNHYYQTLKTQPVKFKLARFLFAQSRFRDASELDQAVEECLQALKKETPTDEKDLEKIALQFEGCSFKVMEFDESLETSLHPKILDFARKAKPGELSLPIKLNTTTLIMILLERILEPPPSFDACQEKIRTKLSRDKRSWAQQIITMDLIQKADFRPNDLFDPFFSSSPLARKANEDAPSPDKGNAP